MFDEAVVCYRFPTYVPAARFWIVFIVLVQRESDFWDYLMSVNSPFFVDGICFC